MNLQGEGALILGMNAKLTVGATHNTPEHVVAFSRAYRCHTLHSIEGCRGKRNCESFESIVFIKIPFKKWSISWVKPTIA